MRYDRKENRELLDTYHAMHCLVCNGTPCDPSHVKSVGSGGPDEPWNVKPLCRGHHTLWHSMGWRSFIRKFPVVRFWFEKNGWDLNDLTNPKLLS